MVRLVSGSLSDHLWTGKYVRSCSVYPKKTSDMFELVENTLFAYSDDSALLAVVCKQVDRPVTAVSLNNELRRIQEWCIAGA